MSSDIIQNEAVFFDRDGTLVELLYDKETGRIDSASNPGQIRLIPGVAESLRLLRNAGYKLILFSNQPGIAKGRMTIEDFEATKEYVRRLLSEKGVNLDAEYYCLHHPNSLIAEYRQICDCRKPKPGMILQAAAQFELNLDQCYVIGDDLMDIKAGEAAGCKTILLSHVTGLLLDIISENGIKLDAIKGNLIEAVEWIIMNDSSRRMSKEVKS